MRLGLFVVLTAALFAVGCGAPTSRHATPPPISVSNDFEARVRDWQQNGPITTTCAEWKSMTRSDQLALAQQMLATISSFDPQAPGEPDAAQTEKFRTGISDDCSMGSECSVKDAFCGSGRVTIAAASEYEVYVSDLLGD